MSRKPIFAPVCQVRAKSLVLYSQLMNREEFPRSSTVFQSNKERVVYTGSVTKGATKRLKKAIQTLVAISKNQVVYHDQWSYPIRFRLSFITLTLPAPQETITDREIINKALAPFLRECTRKDKLNHYIWKAERQKNGNIHFHITTNVFIHYQTVQDRWNNHLQKFGLIDKFESVHNHRNPHSTEIRAVRNVTEIEKYLQKYYMKKAKEGDEIKGKLWDCSLSLKSVPWPSFIIDEKTNNHLTWTIQHYNENLIDLEKCSILWFDERNRSKFFNDTMTKLFYEFCETVRKYKRHVDPIPNTSTAHKTIPCGH